MSQQGLDCLVLGYSDETPAILRRLEGERSDSVEARIFQRNCLRVDGTPMVYMEVLNHFLGLTEAWARRDAVPFYHVGEVTNLAALYLTSFLLERGCTAMHVGLPSAEMALLHEILRAQQPAVVAITTTFYESPNPVAELVSIVRAESPDSLVVVGGPLVSNLVAESDAVALQHAFFAMGAHVYVHEAQGERTLLSVVTAVRCGQSLGLVPNLYLSWGGGQFVSTGIQREDNVMDECSINWAHFDPGVTAQTRTARSCAYACSFCDYPIRAGKLQVASVEAVERELANLHARGVRNVVFVDDTFNIPHDRFRDICRMMIRRRFGFSWYSYFRCGSVKDPEIFRLMVESGCAGVFLGIESGDASILRNMRKAANPDQYARGMELLNRNEILTFASFICGFPGETDATIDNTIRFINDNQPTLYRVEPFWYGHRSPIHGRATSFGLSGQGYAWTHRTMDSTRACDAIDQFFQSVRGPAWCPQQSFSFWALPYLVGKGMSHVELIEMHRLLGRCLPAETGSSLGSAIPLDYGTTKYQEVQDFVGRLRLSPPKHVSLRGGST